MVLGMEERAVQDGCNHLSTNKFDACLALYIRRKGSNSFAHLGLFVGIYCGDAQQIWDYGENDGLSERETYELKSLTRIHEVPDELCGATENEGVHEDRRATVVY